jgi:hypothetical protein
MSSQPLLTSSDQSHPLVGNADHCPDPDGVDFDPRTMQQVPFQVCMGGRVASRSSVSTMTARFMVGNPLSHHWAPSLSSMAQSILFDPILIESVGSIVSIHDRSSSPSNQSALCPPTSIKEKLSDMGIGNITDKDSWLEVKKVIDSCLQQAPFWPHPTLKALVTTKDNKVAMFDDGTSSSIPADSMPALIPKPTVDVSMSAHLLPLFFQLSSKITFEKDGQYHKGFLTQSTDGIYRFSYKTHDNI